MTYATFPGSAVVTEQTAPTLKHPVNMPAALAGESIFVVGAADNFLAGDAAWVCPSQFTPVFQLPWSHTQHVGYSGDHSGDNNITIKVWRGTALGTEGGTSKAFGTPQLSSVCSFVSFRAKPASGGLLLGGTQDAYFSGTMKCPPSPSTADATTRGDHYDYTMLSIWAREAVTSMLPKPLNYTFIGQALSDGGTQGKASCGVAWKNFAHGTMPGSGGEQDGYFYVCLPGQADWSPWQPDRVSRLSIMTQLALTDNVSH